ncbi:hypothetical protein F4778DRAFT_575646 [Xylariomycetidae sp. FL2044]|nr:hypothetical protein F4778DRAFT_575646 [Xylariomycetidae sp. FL2044]
MASIKDLLSPSEQETPDGPGDRGQAAMSDSRPMAQTTTHFNVEFIFDTHCPHSYIGFKHLLSAIEIHKARYPGATFELTCSPFFLDPDAAKSGYSKEFYYTTRRGYHGDWLDRWDTLGAAVGINFSWKGIVGNSIDSHKMLRFALESTPTTARSTSFARQQQSSATTSFSSSSPTSRNQHHHHHASFPSSHTAPTTPQPRGPALQLRLLEALFRGFHEQDRDISDPDFLTATTASVTGFPASEVRAILGCGEDGEDEDEDKDEDEEDLWTRTICDLVEDVKDRGIRGIPTVIVNNRYVYGGWQQAEFFVEEFGRIRNGVGVGVGGGDR